MRNYNSKPHSKPLTQNAFRKSDRKYPDPKKLNQNKKTPLEEQTISPGHTKLNNKSHHKNFNEN